MPTKPDFRTHWTEACRSGACSTCGYADEVLQISLGGMLVRLCNDCATVLVHDLQRHGIKPFRPRERRR